MSPTQRDILKASAGAIAATLAGSHVAAAADPETPITVERFAPPLGEIRKGAMIGMMNPDESRRISCSEYYFDGDLDGSWTLLITPYWRKHALLGEWDCEGIYRCDDYTAGELMEIMWTKGQEQRPTVTSAKLILDEDLLFENLGHRRAHWVEHVQRRRDYVDVEELNDWEQHPWEFVVWNHPLLDQYPGANAIIECQGHFYAVVVDKEPVNCPCCA